MTDIHITIHLEADKLANALEILAAAILGTPASKAEGTQFQLQPVRGSEGADPEKVAAVVTAKLRELGVTPTPDAPPPPAAAPQVPTAPPPMPSPASTLTMEQVRSKLADRSKAGHTERIKGVLKSFGAATLKDVDPARYGELLAAVEAL